MDGILKKRFISDFLQLPIQFLMQQKAQACNLGWPNTPI
jgi:hypothetical protein